MKNFFMIITIILLVVLSIFHHFAVMNVQKANETLWFKIPIKYGYKDYFFLKDRDPRYVFDLPIFEKYATFCHEKKKNCIIFLWQQLYSSLIWLSSVQYIWSVMDTRSAPYLYWLLNSLTNLSPYWEYPYKFWALILPASKYTEFPADKMYLTWINSVILWEKWASFLCEKEKTDKIDSFLGYNIIYDTIYQQTWSMWEDNKNPCNSYNLVESIAFNYFYYLKNMDKSIQYYKYAAFHKDVLLWIKWMISVVAWELWEYEKSMHLFLQKAISAQKVLEKRQLSQKEVELYEKEYIQAINRWVVEFHFFLLKNADNNECLHDYNCLITKWFLKTEIKKIYDQCEANLENIQWDIQKIFENIKSPKQLEDTWKCIYLKFSIQNNYTSPDWNLTNAINNKHVYYWDEERDRWWMWIR